jgi:hypothetical protein
MSAPGETDPPRPSRTAVGIFRQLRDVRQPAERPDERTRRTEVILEPFAEVDDVRLVDGSWPRRCPAEREKPFGRSERADFGDDLFAHDPNLFCQIG